jgi:hypothetical protein
MLDITGKPIEEGAAVQLLCTVLDVDEERGVTVRVMNSEMQLLVLLQHDEVLGVRAASELLVVRTAQEMQESLHG